MSGAVLDTGALIAVERGDRRVVTLLAEARRTGAGLTVPSGCVAQAWRQPARQARLALLLRQRDVTVVALDDADARRVGLLFAARGGKDVVDGHVALCAHRTGHTILTSDLDDLRQLAPDARIERV